MFLTEDQILRRRKQTIKGDGHSTLPVENDSSDSSRNLSVAVLPFILHLGFMAATAFFVMHVQVRFTLTSFFVMNCTFMKMCRSGVEVIHGLLVFDHKTETQNHKILVFSL